MRCKNIYQEKSKRKNISNSGIFTKKAHLGKGAPSLRFPFLINVYFSFWFIFVCFFLCRVKYSHICKKLLFLLFFFQYVARYLQNAQFFDTRKRLEWLSLLLMKPRRAAHISISKRTRCHSSVGAKSLIGSQPAPIAYQKYAALPRAYI